MTKVVNICIYSKYFKLTPIDFPLSQVNIYFDDVRQMRGTQASTVGLFLKIKNFGDVKEVVFSN